MHFRRFRFNIITGVVVLVFACCFVAGCGQSPEGVAESFIKGCVNGDTQSSAKLFYDQEEGTLAVGLVRMGLSMTEDRDFTYETVYEKDGEAVVQVEGDSGHFCRLELEQIDGKWLVTYVE